MSRRGPAACCPGPEPSEPRTLTILREIVFDTETTGVDHTSGDRVVEIGCVEMQNHIPTGRVHHVYINPARAMSAGAYEVHGLSDAFLSDKPLFAAVADELHDFFGDARLIAHNATFDIGFLNAEFGRTGHPVLVMDRVVDTLSLARRKHPGASNSLDALCQRFKVDNSSRTLHGALLDAQLLAEVYMELLGGRQSMLGLATAEIAAVIEEMVELTLRSPRSFAPSIEELAAHAAMLDQLKDPIWLAE